MATFTVNGSIINTLTRAGITGLRVEAWGRPVKASKKLTATTTDAEGRFALQFDMQVSSQNPDPLGLLKIFFNDSLLHTTPEQPIKQWTEQAPPLIIEVDQPASAEGWKLSLILKFSNKRPGAGMHLVFSYLLPSGDTWTSPQLTADAEGTLSFEVPLPAGATIDLDRASFAFSRFDKPLQIVKIMPPEHVPGATLLTIQLAPEKIVWPPEQDPNKWYVRGRVTTPYGEAIRANVSAAAIGLADATALGQVQTSDTGRYEIAYEWDSKCLPDLQVSANVADRPIAQSAIHFAAGKSVRIDLIAGNEPSIEQPEYQTVEGRVRKCVADVDVTGIGDKQFDYLLGKTRLTREKLAFYLTAQRLQALCDLPAAIFYGLFRGGLPANLQGLVLQRPAALQRALSASIQNNIIDRKYGNSLEPLLAALRQMAVAGSLTSSQQLDRATVCDLLAMAGVPASVQPSLVNLYFEREGDDASFWETLSQDDQLAQYTKQTRTSLQAGALTSYHLPTLQALTTRLGAGGAIEDLALWQPGDWESFAQSLEAAPSTVPGETQAEKIQAYVGSMSRTVKRAFEREYTTANVLRSDAFPDPILHEFLNTVPDFDYGTSSIPAALDKTPFTGEERQTLEKTLKSMQRLYRVAPLEQKFTVMETLYAGGVTSAREITLHGAAQFVDTYADALGGPEIAGKVYDNAAAVTAVATQVLASYSELFSAGDVFAIGGGVTVSPPDRQGDLVLPSYEDLFGSQSFCQCEDCSSVYSPAAYCVDLLEFLRQSLVTRQIGGNTYVKILKNGVMANKTGLDVLFARRPDLGDIRLDCKNTNTVLPYIDLVNECFERAVVGETDSTLYQTNWTEPELRANPEHILGEAYDVLAQTIYPLTLPFRLWNVEAEHYLKHLGALRWKLMETLLARPDSGNAEFKQVSFAYLGLGAIDVDILAGAPAYSGTLEAVGKLWGYTAPNWRAPLASVPEFLTRSGLSYDELLQLLQVPYVQAGGEFGIDFGGAESACDVDGAVLHYIVDGVFDDVRLLSKETWERILRFLRLLHKTGWSIWELGRVLSALAQPQLTVQTVVQVSTIKRLADDLGLDVLDVLSWWAKLDTALDANNPDYRSFYESVFLNPAVLNPPDLALVLDEDRTRLAVEAAGGARISEHFSSIAAALQLTEADTRLIGESLLDSSGAMDDALTLDNLSRMYRIASLCQALGIEISQYFLMARLIEDGPWDSGHPEDTVQFVIAVQFQQASQLSASELGYLLLHDEASVLSVQMAANSVANLLADIQGAVRAVWGRYAPSSSTPLSDQLNTRLGAYFDQATSDRVLTLVGQAAPYSPEDQAYLQETLAFLSPIKLIDAIDQGKPVQDRYRNLLVLLNSYGRITASINVVAQMIANAFTLDLTVAQMLITEVVPWSGHPGEYLVDALLQPLFIDSGKEKLAAALSAEYLQDAFSIVEGTSTMPDDDIEDFIELHFTFLDPEEAKAQLAGPDALADVLDRYQYVTAPLDEAQYLLSEVVFAEQFAAIYTVQKSALVVNKFQVTETELSILNQHAAALRVLPVKGYPFVEQASNFPGFRGWQNLSDLVSLRRVFVAPGGDLFAQVEKILSPGLIDIATPNEEVEALIASGQWQDRDEDRQLLVWLYELASAAVWSFMETVYVAGPELLRLSDVSRLQEVDALVYLAKIMEHAAHLGTTAAQLKAWSVLDLTQTDAANAKQTARARYTLDQWYGVAPTLRDELRERQRDALTAYILYQGGFGTTTDLYNHYLFDAEMSACMLTSRLKLTLSSIQLFIQRCLLNLEDEFVAITAADEWEWRKNYRVWEANRKVFLYPENYIKPELRLTRSEVFEAAQSVLLQNEVTEEVAEQSLLRYLEGLDEISNLEVAGSYHETGLAQDGVTVIDRLHVVAATRGVPHKYFYRYRDRLSWSPWEGLDADIDAGQVLPLAVNGRLYVLWPVFFEKQVAGTEVLSKSTMNEAKDTKIEEENWDAYLDYLVHYDYGVAGSHSSLYEDGYSSVAEWAEALGATLDDTIEFLVEDLGMDSFDEFTASAQAALDGAFEETITYYEIKLSVSEYRNGNWMPPRTSEFFIESEKKNSALALLEGNQVEPTPGDFHFYTAINGDVVTVDCVQTLRYTNEPIREYSEGSFEYNVLSKEILAIDAKDDLREPAILAPAGTDVVDNAFVEGEERTLEIPVVGAWSTFFVALLEKTPGTFRVPLQHQNEQFSAGDLFFFGDDKRTFIISAEKTLSAGHSQPFGGGFSSLGEYLNSETPGLGVYDAFIQDYSSTLHFDPGSILTTRTNGTGRIGRSIAALSTTPDISLTPWQDTAVSEYYPVTRDAYRFASFYHPLVGDLIKKVNGEGVLAALAREVQRTSKKYFVGTYQPTDDVTDDYPLRDFSFSDLDANGFYNYEFFFHLPLLIATRLSKNQQFADAQRWFHTIFDPTCRAGAKGAQRFWQFKPFFDMYENTAGHPFDSIYDQLAALAAEESSADSATLELKRQAEEQIAVWRANPFDPHAIAALRPVAYMKAVVMAYLDNLIVWGDYLYEQFTHESINEAMVYYILAYQILGDRPVALPELDVVSQSYNELGTLDAFSNAVAQLENVINLPQASQAGSMSVPSLYFCIPNNPTMLQYWDTIADRLFKIRHCMTIEGIVQQLPLFEPPINPELLVAARAGGVSISAALASLATPAPHYRFVFLMQKAVEYCQVVKGLGSQLLAAYEKRDAEDLGLLRAKHEESLLKASTELKNLQVDESRENLAALEKSKLLVQERIEYYSNLEKRSEKEKAAVKRLDEAELKRLKSSDKEMTASRSNLFPNLSANFGSTGASFGTSYGGSNIGASLSADAAKARGESEWHTYHASKLSTDASYDRRWDDWKLQQRLAKKELKQVEKQIVAAQIRLALAEKERDNHAIQLQQAREVKDFLTGKFSNQELYGWLVSQTSAIYFQSYKLAYDLAKRAEKAYQRETGEYDSTYIAYGYFDSMKKGLLSGDRLHHDLQRMEFDYLNNNRREYEITKHVSLASLDPVALLNLTTTGECAFSIPESLYDLDYPGHYMRRIKSVSLTVPSVTGPYTGVPCRLTLVSSRTRVDPITAGSYVFNTDGDDARFRVDTGAGQSIAPSSGREDAGLFASDLRDERYLPFETMGAISDWSLKLTSVAPTFDWQKISDVVLHIQYTAREGGDQLRAAATEALAAALAGRPLDNVPLPGIPLRSAFSARYTFPSEWSAFLHPSQNASVGTLKLDIAENRFPYFARNANLSVRGLEVVALVEDTGDHPLTEIFVTPPDEQSSTAPLALTSSDSLYGGSPNATVSYEDRSDKPGPGLWTITLPVSGSEDLSQLNDLVVVATYDITIPVPA